MRSASLIHQPLLSDAEVAELLRETPVLARQSARPALGRSGDLSGQQLGSGSDFADLRQYESGDDPRHIDWRVSARSSNPFVRQFHSDLASPLYLLLDRRASMRFGTRKRLKATQALRLALRLGTSAVREGRELACLILDSDVHWQPPQRGMLAIHGLLRQANLPCPPRMPQSNDATWRSALSLLREQLPVNSELWLLSDFLQLNTPDFALLRSVGQQAEARAVRIQDPSEQQIPIDPSIELHWQQRTLRLDAATQAQLEQARQRHEQSLKQIFRRSGIALHTLAADADLAVFGS